MDGRINNKGTKGNNGGNPGYGKLNFIREKVKQHSELWWKEWEDLMNSRPDEFINDNVKELVDGLIKKGDNYTAKEIIKDLAKGAFYRKQFAMTEFNKIQTKLIPQDVEMGGEMLLKIAKEIADKNEDYDTNENTGENS